MKRRFFAAIGGLRMTALLSLFAGCFLILDFSANPNHNNTAKSEFSTLDPTTKAASVIDLK